MVQVSIHDVKKIRYERVFLDGCLSNNTFVARVDITNEKGEKTRLTLFSEKKSNLNFTEVSHLK